MDERIATLENEIRSLARSIRDIESRLADVEARTISQKAAPAEPPAAVRVKAQHEIPPGTGWSDATQTLSLTGRFFIIMGGAYLLRALTEASTLSAALGVSLGLAYAVLWCAAGGLDAGKDRLWSGAFHGIAATLIAYPLLWEAVRRFHILAPPFDAWLLAGLTAVFLAVAVKYRFEILAWLAVVGSIVTAGALMLISGSFVPHTIFLIVLGVATLWVGYELEWRGLRWPVALFANLAVFGLTVRALTGEPKESPAAALTVQLLLLGLYLASIAVRTLVRARNVVPFEVVQMIAAFLLGFIGAVYTTRTTDFGTHLLGGAGFLLGAACYAVAFAFVDRREGRGRNFYFYTSLALLFSLTGSGLLLSGTALSLAWVMLAILMGRLGWRFSRLALVLHATISILAAAFVTGLVSYAATALFGPPHLVGAAPTAAQLLVLAGAAIRLATPRLGTIEVGPILSRIQRLAITIVLVGGIGGILDSLVGRMWGGLPQGGVDPGFLATLRTVVLSLAALILAWMGRRERFLEWGWLVYPVLAATGVKILLEDLSRSRPATLFAALALYGCALILSPSLRRASRGKTSS